jgi:hypothetical protein
MRGLIAAHDPCPTNCCSDFNLIEEYRKQNQTNSTVPDEKARKLLSNDRKRNDLAVETNKIGGGSAD